MLLNFSFSCPITDLETIKIRANALIKMKIILFGKGKNGFISMEMYFTESLGAL